MNLHNFESFIDKKILARGLDYYENGYVSSIEEIEDKPSECLPLLKTILNKILDIKH